MVWVEGKGVEEEGARDGDEHIRQYGKDQRTRAQDSRWGEGTVCHRQWEHRQWSISWPGLRQNYTLRPHPEWRGTWEELAFPSRRKISIETFTWDRASRRSELDWGLGLQCVEGKVQSQSQLERKTFTWPGWSPCYLQDCSQLRSRCLATHNCLSGDWRPSQDHKEFHWQSPRSSDL